MPDPDTDRASALIRDALHQRREQLSGVSRLPPEDKALSERILGEARRRSGEISASQAATALSNRRPVAAPGIPWWLYLAWALAIAGVFLAFRFLA